MSRLALMLTTLLLTPLASAQTPAEPPTPISSASRAEYQRLSQELERLSSKNAWSGVERTYQGLVATGVPPSFNDLLVGAHSARVIGDTLAARERLAAATKLGSSREVIDWMWSIDQGYGRVFIACDSKAGRELSAEAMPFAPDERVSVEFAIAKVATDHLFDGYLPAGRYSFGADQFEVIPQVQSVRMDLRSSEARARVEPKADAALSKKELKKRAKEEKQAKKEQEKVLKALREQAAERETAPPRSEGPPL